MADHSTIEWTDATWNPIRGCSRVSEGCRHCYAETVAARFSGPGLAYEGLAKRVGGEARWTNEVHFVATGGHSTIPGSRYMARVGKKVASALLDGREWLEYPEVHI